MSFLVALVLSGKRCLVVGSGAEATRRARDLAEAGATVLVVAPEPSVELTELEGAGVRVERRAYQDTDVDGTWLAVLADRDELLLARVGAACAARGSLFCAIDQPGWNSFNHVAVARAGSVQVAVSTDGTAPALAKRLRDELERSFGDGGVAAFADELAALRSGAAPSERRRLLTDAAARLSLGPVSIAPETPEDTER